MGLVGTPVTAVMMRGCRHSSRAPACRQQRHPAGRRHPRGGDGRPILSGVYRDRMADAELPGTTQGLSPAAEEQARTSAEAARSLADSLHLPELAATADRAFLDAMYAATLSVAALALIGCAVAVVGLRTRAAPEGREHTTASDTAREGQTR